MRGRRHRHDVALRAPIRAVLAEKGPAHPRSALQTLKAQHRVAWGTTMSDAYEACRDLAEQGDLEHVTRAGATGGGYFRVPGDTRPRWDLEGVCASVCAAVGSLRLVHGGTP